MQMLKQLVLAKFQGKKKGNNSKITAFRIMNPVLKVHLATISKWLKFFALISFETFRVMGYIERNFIMTTTF